MSKKRNRTKEQVIDGEAKVIDEEVLEEEVDEVDLEENDEEEEVEEKPKKKKKKVSKKPWYKKVFTKDNAIKVAKGAGLMLAGACVCGGTCYVLGKKEAKKLALKAAETAIPAAQEVTPQIAEKMIPQIAEAASEVAVKDVAENVSMVVDAATGNILDVVTH